LDQEASEILIVDDNQSNRNVLEEFLSMIGQKSSQAEGGAEALKMLQKKDFDAILLDIMMPEMDGYQTLSCIKKNKRTQHIPVIMITAIDDRQSVEKCIESGADDYLVKPFNPVMLKARLSGCLARKKLYDMEKKTRMDTEMQNRELEEKVKEKTRELYFAYKKLSTLDKAKNDFIKVISHELRTPLTGFGCIADLVFEEAGDAVSPSLYKAYKDTYDRLSTLVDQAILLSNIEVDYTCICASVRDIINNVIGKETDICFSADSATDIKCLCDVELLTMAFKALISTALKLKAASKKLNISLNESYSNNAIISIETEGPLLPEDFIPVFFEPMPNPQMLSQDRNWGLAPVVAAKIIEIFSGNTSIANKKDGSGVVITVTLSSKQNLA
jgi:CheY-like chemotaxis protein/nitrogen-specific signal transduction histidine kinase